MPDLLLWKRARIRSGAGGVVEDRFLVFSVGGVGRVYALPSCT